MDHSIKPHRFLAQGAVLAAAAIAARIIGLIYRMPLTDILGNVGNNYYGCAFDIYYIVWLISSYSLPTAVSKLVAKKRAEHDDAGSLQVVRCGLFYAAAVGLTASVLVFGLSGMITGTLLLTPLAAPALRMLAPALLVAALTGVYRGFFQGMEWMNQSAASMVLEQLVNAIISVAAAAYLTSYGRRKMPSKESYALALGAAGGSLGTVAGALAGLCLLVLLYRKKKLTMQMAEPLKKKQREQGTFLKRSRLQWKELLCPMLSTIFPIMAATALFNMNLVVEQGLFKYLMRNAVSKHQLGVWWGVFSGKYRTVINLPIAAATAIGAACIPGITTAASRKDLKEANKKIQTTLRATICMVVPASLVCALFAGPIMRLLFRDDSLLSKRLLLFGSVNISLYGLSTVTANILQAIGELKKPLLNSAVALFFDIGVLVVLIHVSELGIYAVLISMTAFGICVTVLNQLALWKSGHLKCIKYPKT